MDPDGFFHNDKQLSLAKDKTEKIEKTNEFDFFGDKNTEDIPVLGTRRKKKRKEKPLTNLKY